MSEARGLRDLEEGRTGDGGLSLAVIAGGAGLLYANHAGFRGYVDKKAGQIRTIVGRPLLPKNWVEQKDEHGNKIWFNTVTKLSSHVLPRPEPDDPDGLPEHWEPHKDARGRDYYYNTKTRESTFERPQKAAPVQRNWIGMKKTVPPPPAPAAVRSFGYNGEPAPVHALPEPAPSNSRADRRAAAKAKKQTTDNTHNLKITGLKVKLQEVQKKATKRAETARNLTGIEEWAAVRTKTAAFKVASQKFIDFIIKKDKLGGIKDGQPIFNFHKLRGQVTTKEKSITSQRLQKQKVDADVLLLITLLRGALAAFETYELTPGAVDKQDAKSVSIRTLLPECIAAVEAFKLKNV